MNKATKDVILDALTELTRSRASGPEEARWFTRRQIAVHLRAPSGGLNPSRTDATDELVEDGTIEIRTKPRDSRGVKQYHLKE